MTERTLEIKILEELKERSVDSREIKTILGTVLDRMTVIETVVMGVNKDNGIHGSVKRIESILDNMKHTVDIIDSDINNKDTGIKDRMKCSEDYIDSLNKFKLKIYTISGGAYVLMGILVWLAEKFNFFGVK